MWLGRRFGGEIFFRAIGEFSGAVPIAVTSISSVSYSENLGVGFEEELEVRARFLEGQMLSDDDLSALVGYVSGRCRLDGNGFGLVGVVVGIELNSEPRCWRALATRFSPLSVSEARSATHGVPCAAHHALADLMD